MNTWAKGLLALAAFLVGSAFVATWMLRQYSASTSGHEGTASASSSDTAHVRPRLPAPATARDVCVIGDSLTWFYGRALAAAHPEWDVHQGSLKSDCSSNLSRVRAFLRTTPCDDVVLLFGTNDAGVCVEERITPRQTVRHLERMAAYARFRGATRVVLLTPPPVVCFVDSFCKTHDDIRKLTERMQAHTEEEARLLRTRRPRRNEVLGDLRAQFPTTREWIACSAEGIHPNAAGIAVMVAVVEAGLAK